MSKTRGKNTNKTTNKTTIRHRRNKNSIQKSRGKHRRKTMKYLGGGPKINFPYVYYEITKTMLDNNPVLNQYIQWRTCVCIERVEGKNTDVITAKCGDPSITTVVIEPIHMLSDDNMVIILVMKYDSAMRMTREPGRLNDAKVLLTEILGHAIVKVVGGIACISNVCGHAREGEGYGKILFNSVMQFIKDKAPFDKIKQCWLNVHLHNVAFDKVIYIYVSAGFGGGSITDTDPWGNQEHELFMSLYRDVSTDIVNALTTRIELSKVLQLKNQFGDCIKTNTNYSTFTFKFDKNCIMHLRLLPFSATKMINGTIVRGLEAVNDTSGISNIRELGGVFNIYNVEDNEFANSVYTLSLTTLAEDASIQYTLGPDEDKLSVIVPISSYSFHTHPIQGYYEYNVILMTPSEPDFRVFFGNLFITPSFNSNFIIPQFNMVVTVEGVYIISLDKQAIEHIDYLVSNKDRLYEEISRLEYPIKNRYFDWNNFDSLAEDAVTTALSAYTQWFQAKNIIILGTGRFPLFKLDIIRWKDLNVEKQMEVNCPLINHNPYVESSEFSSILPTVKIDTLYSSKDRLKQVRDTFLNS